MKKCSALIASCFALIVGNAFAHGDHPSSHGGIMGRGDDAVIVEFVMEKDTLAVYVHDEDGKPLPTEGVTGTVSLFAPQRAPVEVKLVRINADKFTAPDLKPVTGERLRARLKLPNGQEIESLALYAK